MSYQTSKSHKRQEDNTEWLDELINEINSKKEFRNDYD
tara:strand:- start:279 stop:392 length:114 start_codon:yes stop_codon:yes gene_type:complete